MDAISILFYFLNGSSVLNIQSQEDDINDFVCELFETFDHIVNNNDLSINLNPYQQNTEKLRTAVGAFVGKYSTKWPKINQLNKLFKHMADGEYFMAILNHKPMLGEIYLCYSILMKLNQPTFNIEKSLCDGTNLFKNIWDNYEIVPTEERFRQVIGEHDRNKVGCRFCERTSAMGASFRNEAHAIPEGLGNKTVILCEECDECNEYFGKTIEKDFITTLSFFRTQFGVLNKDNKIPTIKGKNFEYRNLGNGHPTLQIDMDERNPLPSDLSTPPNNVLLRFNETVVRQNIYKALAKFGLSIVDRSILSKFNDTVEWIRCGTNFKKQLPKIALLTSRKLFTDRPFLAVYVRKSDNKNVPYAVAEFRFTVLTFVYIIPTFSDDERAFLSDEEYREYWDFFKYYSCVKEFTFESFDDSTVREFQYCLDLNMVQGNNIDTSHSGRSA